MDYLTAFLVGGAFCIVGQLLMDHTKLTPPRILVIFVTAGAVLTGLGIYGPLVDAVGTGASVPLPGFGYSLVKGAVEGAAADGWTGALTGGVKNTAAGITAAIAFGYLIALLCTPRTKK